MGRFRSFFGVAATLALTAAVATPTPCAGQLSWKDVYEFWVHGRTFDLVMADGDWSYTSDSIRTFGLTFTGTVTIKAPSTGEFRLEAVDLASPEGEGYVQVIDAVVPANEPVVFSHPTGKYVRLRLRIAWSEGESAARTPLRVHVAPGRS
jgi:hypothetical protein